MTCALCTEFRLSSPCERCRLTVPTPPRGGVACRLRREGPLLRIADATYLAVQPPAPALSALTLTLTQYGTTTPRGHAGAVIPGGVRFGTGGPTPWLDARTVLDEQVRIYRRLAERLRSKGPA